MPRDECLRQLLGIILNVFDAHSAVLFLRGETDEYHIAAHSSLSDKIVHQARITPGKGLAGWIIRNKQPLLINNFDRKRGVLGYYESGEEAHIKAFMGCCLDDRLGALCLDSKRTYSFSEKDQKILTQFAQLITHFHTRVCLMEQGVQEHAFYVCLQLVLGLRRKIPKWSAFLDRFLELTAEAAGFSHALMAVRDEYGAKFFIEGANRQILNRKSDAEARFVSGTGLVGWVFKNERPVYTDDSSQDTLATPLFGKDYPTPAFKSVVCLPLVVHKRTRGVLVLASEANVPITSEMKSFFEMLSDYLSLFLENLYLKNKLAENSAE